MHSNVQASSHSVPLALNDIHTPSQSPSTLRKHPVCSPRPISGIFSETLAMVQGGKTGCLDQWFLMTRKFLWGKLLNGGSQMSNPEISVYCDCRRHRIRIFNGCPMCPWIRDGHIRADRLSLAGCLWLYLKIGWNIATSTWESSCDYCYTTMREASTCRDQRATKLIMLTALALHKNACPPVLYMVLC